MWIKNGFFGQDETCGPDMCPNNSCHCKDGKVGERAHSNHHSLLTLTAAKLSRPLTPLMLCRCF